jgi:hypothetical protein
MCLIATVNQRTVPKRNRLVSPAGCRRGPLPSQLRRTMPPVGIVRHHLLAWRDGDKPKWSDRSWLVFTLTPTASWTTELR